MQVRIGVMDIKARDRILKSVDIVRQLESRPDVVALAAAEMSKSIGLEAIQASENRAVMSLDGLLGRAIEEFVGLVGKGEVEGMTASGESAEDAALRAKAAKSCMEMLGMMRQKVIETAKHEIHEVQPHYDTQLRLLLCTHSCLAMRRPVQTRSRRWSHAPSLLQSSKFRQVLRVSRIASGFPPHLIASVSGRGGAGRHQPAAARRSSR